MRRHGHDGRILEFQIDADGGALLVQEDDPARQSVYLTERELLWVGRMAWAAWLKSLWLRDGGGYDRLAARGMKGAESFAVEPHPLDVQLMRDAIHDLPLGVDPYEFTESDE